jgi:Tol biopolymer transport system component
VNTEKYEFDPYISPDESFIIFSINNEQGLSDIYFSYKNEKGEWAGVINMGDKVNTPRQDFGPSLSPDNKFIFFTNGGNLRWIGIGILDASKPKVE